MRTLIIHNAYPNEINFLVINAYLIGKFGGDKNIAAAYRSQDNSNIVVVYPDEEQTEEGFIKKLAGTNDIKEDISKLTFR